MRRVGRKKNNRLNNLITGVIGDDSRVTIDISFTKGGRYFATIRKRDSERTGLGIGATVLEAVTEAIEDCDGAAAK